MTRVKTLAKLIKQDNNRSKITLFKKISAILKN